MDPVTSTWTPAPDWLTLTYVSHSNLLLGEEHHVEQMESKLLNVAVDMAAWYGCVPALTGNLQFDRDVFMKTFSLTAFVRHLLQDRWSLSSSYVSSLHLCIGQLAHPSHVQFLGGVPWRCRKRCSCSSIHRPELASLECLLHHCSSNSTDVCIITQFHGKKSTIVSCLSNQIKSHVLHSGSHEAGLVTRWPSSQRVCATIRIDCVSQNSH